MQTTINPFELVNPSPWKWTTYDGHVVTNTTIDHQHLSNIIWYFVLYQKRTIPNFLLLTLRDRFNNDLLSYRPVFKFEVDALEMDGLLFWNNNKTKATIMYHSSEVGEIILKNIRYETN